MKRLVYLGGLLALPARAAEEVTSRLPAYTPPPSSVVSGGGILQVIISLLLVLAAVGAVAWIIRRINVPHAGTGVLKVISGVAVGQRERIVLVEVNDTWLVVGVAPGQVRTLHTLPKGSVPAGTQPTGDAQFKQWMKVMLEKRNAKSN